MESAGLRLHACMWEVCVCTRGVKLDKARKKVEEAQLQRLLISKCYRECAAGRTFFKLFKSFHMQH